MAKEELLEMNGVVSEVLPDSRYRVTLENGESGLQSECRRQLVPGADPGRCGQ